MKTASKTAENQPSADCDLCPRLVAFRQQNRQAYPDFFNGAVPSFGELEAGILIVGLAPGLKGANQSGRPFTGDYAGEVLYPALLEVGLASGKYAAERGAATREDGLVLHGVRITNAVRCVPPENKPETGEIATCNGFLANEISAMPNLRVVLTLGGIAHKATLKALGLKQSAFTFAHAAEHVPPGHPHLRMVNTYHCSRYNINTNRLSYAMFRDVLARAKALTEGE